MHINCHIVKVRSLNIILAGLFGLGLSAFAEEYPAPDYSGPAARPSFPWNDTFNPPVFHDAVSSETPEISEWTRSNQPGQTMAVAAERLTKLSGNSLNRDTRFKVYGNNPERKVRDALIQRVDGQMAAITLPETIPAEGQYLLWPGNKNGFGKPVAINKTEAWWIGPRKITEGDVFHVYGRNLISDSQNPVCYAYVEETGAWLTSINANPYKADFVLPSSYSNRDYTLWVHNGSGGDYGWDQSLRVELWNGLDWNGGRTLNVMTDYGAKGDGVSDDYSAISSAISAARAGDTVYFPKGVFLVSQSVYTKDNIRYMGAGMDETSIADYTSKSGGFIFENSGEDHVVFSDLTVMVMNTPSSAQELIQSRDSINLLLKNVRLSHLYAPDSTPGGLGDFENSFGLQFIDCEFIINWNLYLGKASNVIFDGCDFYGISDANSLIGARSGNGVAIMNCTAQPYDNSDPDNGAGWAKGRWVSGNGISGSPRHWYIGQNTTINMVPRLTGGVDLNSSEQFMYEGVSVKYRGEVLGATASSVTCNGLSGGVERHAVTIIKGKGLGQTRGVASSSGNAVYLDRPWQVIPDETSEVAIGGFSHRMVVYDNNLEGGPDAADPIRLTSKKIASAGVQLTYGGGAHIVVDKNTMRWMRSGIHHLAKTTISDNSKNSPKPSYFNLYQNNTIDDCLFSLRTRIEWNSGVTEPASLGMIYRNNSSSGATWAVFRNEVNKDVGAIGSEFSIFERNYSENCENSVDDAANYSHQIWINNVFNGDGTGTALPLSYDNHPFLRGNAWNNFNVTYGGNPEAILELPLRVVDASGSGTVNVPVLNCGTDTLRWDASSDSDWISVMDGGRSISRESGGTIALELAGQTLPDVDREAVITIQTTSGETKQFTVAYTADAGNPTTPVDPPTAVLSDLQILGPASLDEETAAQFSCLAYYSDGSSQMVSATWSEAAAYASISTDGVLAAGDVDADKTVEITATFQGVSAIRTVSILFIPPYVTSLEISGSGQVEEQTTATYQCEAIYSDGSRVRVVPNWSLSSPFAALNASGVLTAGDVGMDEDITLFASYGDITSGFAVTIVYIAPAVTVESLMIVAPDSATERSVINLSCTAGYSDGSSESVSPVWSVDSANVSISSAGQLTIGNLDAGELVSITASYSGMEVSNLIQIDSIGNQVIYPLTGFENKIVRAEILNFQTQEWVGIGQMETPAELVVEGLNPGQWYWLSIEEFDTNRQEWISVFTNWMRM